MVIRTLKSIWITTFPLLSNYLTYSRWRKDLNINKEVMQDCIQEFLYNIIVGKSFQVLQVSEALREKIDKF